MIDIPEFTSKRVSFHVGGTDNDGRWQTNYKLLMIDGKGVHSLSWTVDDDWTSGSEEEPSDMEVYQSYVRKARAEAST